MDEGQLIVSIFVYLLAAVVSVWLFRALGLSSVLGYLIAGVVIGPFCLGFVGAEGQKVMHFAEFGVVMMLFLVGLELQPSLLWKLKGPIVGLGGGQVVCTSMVIMGIAMVLGLDWQMALAVGMALALSSTAIVLQYLEEKNLQDSSAGRSAFAVLLSQDIAVIPMLAILPMLATLEVVTGGGSNGHGAEHDDPSAIHAWLTQQPGWVNTLFVLGAIAIIILAGRYLMRPILRSVAKTGVREAFVALALVLVIGIAMLMTSVGVSAALGTFLAGVVLAESEYRHELEADIEPFKGLLLGVFFIAVGASIDFSLIAERPIMVAGVVIGIVVVKAAVVFGLGSVARLVLDQRMIFSLSLAQGSEFAFVLLGFALTAGVLEQETVQLLVASVALSMALTPLIMIFEEKFLRERIGTRVTDGKDPDPMEEDAPVILAGVGRFGNFVARALMAQKIPVTVIDSDADHVEFLRKFGMKTFYGDVSRHDLLHVAGAGKAKLLIIAIDDERQIEKLLETVKKHFPRLEVMVRSLSRQHQFEMVNAGVSTIHQHVGSALTLTERALHKLGYRAHAASRIIKRFMKHDEDAVFEVAELSGEESQLVRRMRSRMEELEVEFEADKTGLPTEDHGWDSEQLRKDVSANEYSSIVPKKDSSVGPARED
ncbi:MAG: monovalent cation:proton antiporter-2 (CPA2) family protein [Verrucomicrobiota bacterium]